MIPNIADIDREIAALESRATTMPVLEKLALLYIVKDHNIDKSEDDFSGKYSRAGGSEFKIAALSIPVVKLVDILDEHMECIKAVYPKEYDAIMRRIKE